MRKTDKIFVACHEGMIGAAILRRLKEGGFTALLTRTAPELDLTDQKAVLNFFMSAKPAYVFLPSVKTGGILANSRYPADFIYENLQAQTNVIHAAWKTGVKKLLFLGSSCIYPKECPQPMKEDYLMAGKLEPTSEPYAIAKIAGIRLCQACNLQYGTKFITAVPSDVYGPGDDFNQETAHFLAALMDRMHRAKLEGKPEVVVWGSGKPKRETLYVDDLAAACLFLMDKYDDSEIINIGSGQDTSIAEMAELIKVTTGYQGKIVLDKTRPDGAPRKLLDISRIRALGWSPETGLEAGLKQTYRWYLKRK